MRTRRVTLAHDTCDGAKRLCGRSHWASVPPCLDLSPNGVLRPLGRRPSDRGRPAWMSRRVNALAATASSIWPWLRPRLERQWQGSAGGLVNGDLELEFR